MALAGMHGGCSSFILSSSKCPARYMCQLVVYSCIVTPRKGRIKHLVRLPANQKLFRNCEAHIRCALNESRFTGPMLPCPFGRSRGVASIIGQLAFLCYSSSNSMHECLYSPTCSYQLNFLSAMCSKVSDLWKSCETLRTPVRD